MAVRHTPPTLRGPMGSSTQGPGGGVSRGGRMAVRHTPPTLRGPMGGSSTEARGCWRCACRSIIAFSSKLPELQFSSMQFLSLTLPCSFSITSPSMHRGPSEFLSLSEQQPRVSNSPSPAILVRETMQAELLGSRQGRLEGITWMRLQIQRKTYLVPSSPFSQALSFRLTLLQVRHLLTAEAAGRRMSSRLPTAAKQQQLGNIATACLQLAKLGN